MGTGRRDEDETEFDELRTGSLDGALSDELVGPEMQAVIEAGGGVAEGFEQSEAALVENATGGPEDGTLRILEDAGAEEAEEDRGVYGEADHEHVADEEQ